jgi:transposase InsO family protein
MKTHYSCAELAALKLEGFPTAKKNLIALVERERWESQPRVGRGGGKEYLPPQPVLKKIRAQEKLLASVTTSTLEQKIMQSFVAVMAKKNEDEAAAEESLRQRGEEQLKMLAGGLSGHEALSLTAHCEIAEGWKVWFYKNQPLKKWNSWAPYAHAYNLDEVPVSKAVRDAFPSISLRSVQRWVCAYEQGNYEALVDRRNGSDKKGKTLFNATPLLAAYAKNILMQRPGIKTEQLCELLGTASRDAVTGEQLFTAPSYHQTWRFQTAWIEENKDLYLQATNPDAFKNSVMLAFGSYSADVTALNQRWEMDATPADWLLLDADGKKRRYTVSVIIDVWSRRAIVVVSRTPKTETHCIALRQALLAWGVPVLIVTDNGQDYQSEHFKRVLKSLGIEHKTTLPFSPEEKPHVERFIGTLNHSILELLPNFAGHSVADRKAIEARKSFAERLAKKGELVDFADIADGTCSGETLQKRINTWLDGSYEHNEHGGLKTTPFIRANSWTGEITRIRDERSLDLLLAKPAGNSGRRTLQKKGINLDGTWFIAPELASIEMGSVLDLYETSDLGKIVVYYRKNFLCIAEAPERTGVDRIEIAKKADAMQKERLKDARAQIKAETKGLPDTGEVLERYLNERAATAGKLVQGDFGKASTTHTSHGLEQAGKAKAALGVAQPSSRAAELQALAAKAMAEAPINVTPLPAAKAHATPLEGTTTRERYVLHCQYAELVAAHGGDIEVLTEAWQRRFFLSFPESSIYRAEAALAKAQKETAAR